MTELQDQTGARAAFGQAAGWLTASPLYELLCRRTAEDDLYEQDQTFDYFVSEGASFRTWKDARKVLTSVSFVLRQRAGRDQLAEYFPVLGGQREPDERAYQLFRELLRDKRATIAERLNRPVVLDDPIGGIRVLRLVDDYLQQAYADPVPIDLMCVGAAAGLELVADLVEPELLERHEVTRRIGVDLVPVDVRRREELDWMLSFLLPEDVAGQQRMEHAARLLAETGVILTQRDAFAAVGDPIRDRAVPVVFGVSFLCSVEHPERMDEVLRTRGGDVLWVSDEAAGVMTHLGMGEGLDEVDPSSRVSRLTHYRDGEVVAIQQRITAP